MSETERQVDMYLKVVGKWKERANEQTQMIECSHYHVSKSMRRIYIDSLSEPNEWKRDIEIWKYDIVEIFGMNPNGKTVEHFTWYKSEAEKIIAADLKQPELKAS